MRQITIDEYLNRITVPHPVEIMSLCDDAYCPECNSSLDETKYLDCEKCPFCGLRIDWGPWHRMNDEEG